MEGKILDFGALLRQNGLRVSVAEHMDAFHALECLGIGDRATFKDTLRTTLVKRGVDVPTYDELFDLYFGGLGKIIKTAADASMAAMQLDGPALQALLEQLARVLDDMDIKLSELARALLSNDTGRIERILRAALARAEVGKIQRPFQEGRYTHSLAEQVGLGSLTQEFEALQRQLSEAGLESELAERLRRFLDRQLQDFGDIIRRAVRAELAKRDQSLRDNERLRSLAEKSFYYLSEDEIRRMKEAVTKLAQRLKNIVAIRRRRAKRGRFDIKDTLRKNLQYGGIPFKIQFDHRAREKPQVLILCDVSDSVRNVSRFMLQFVYSLQDLYSRVRSFIFVSELGEITPLFKEHEINEAIDLALTGNVINVFAHSDFGRAFRSFHRDYLPAVNAKTTVIILGDGRNNYNLPHEWVLKEIQSRAKQVIWLNPENRMTWGFGDSEMDRYLSFCDLAEECKNLNQLYKVIDRLIA